jgi:hypothetical protein
MTKRGASSILDGDIHVEIKDRDGVLKGTLLIPIDKTFEGKGKKISVSTLLSLLFSQGYKNMYIYLVHCRSIKEGPDTPGLSIMPTGRYPLVHPTPYNKNTVYLIAQAHGETRPHIPLLPSDTISQDDIDKVLYRANLGSKCRQHGPQTGEYQVYDQAMGSFVIGTKIKIHKTDDLLHIKGMELVLSNYSLRGDARFLKRASFSGVEVNSGSELKRQKRIETGIASEFGIMEYHSNRGISSKQQKPNGNIHKGGSIRKTVKKRNQKRKTKTKSRTRNRKR